MKQYIVDNNLRRLPFGMPGELIVAGHQVARGYLNRPEKNAEVFIRNPFSDEKGYEHAYRTGDIVRLLPDGTADFIGRNDGQVKVRGFRIELSEVESIIRKFPGIKDATVQAFDEATGGKFIAAYVVSDEPVDVDALGEFIRRDKPAYMVPAVTMQIDRIPLNQNQKVNKRALPEPVKNTGSDAKEARARPLTLFEKEIASIIKRLLGDIEIDTAEPLIHYGLTSISAIGLVATLADHISIGRPILNCSEYIVDSDLNLLPRGVIGELLIGGIGVARGYRNLPDQTEKRFIFYHGERVYRSGDYAKWDAEGNVIVLGRMDGQIKLRGLRIELGEIEGLMEQQPHIRHAVASVRRIGGSENLCAWFTEDKKIDLACLREQLSQKLTHYMVPFAMMQVEAIPVTPNGKTNLKALPDPEISENGLYEAQANETEAFFCKLFADIVGTERGGATDDFFSIGGTSLAVTSVMIKATENGYELTYGDVFKYTTPRKLASRFTGTGESVSLSAARFDSYNYDQIHEMLSHHHLDSYAKGEKRPVGNILLTGATGYMGIHVLAEYLTSYGGDYGGVYDLSPTDRSCFQCDR